MVHDLPEEEVCVAQSLRLVAISLMERADVTESTWILSTVRIGADDLLCVFMMCKLAFDPIIRSVTYVRSCKVDHSYDQRHSEY